jgi:hypothetical protein
MRLDIENQHKTTNRILRVRRPSDRSARHWGCLIGMPWASKCALRVAFARSHGGGHWSAGVSSRSKRITTWQRQNSQRCAHPKKECGRDHLTIKMGHSRPGSKCCEARLGSCALTVTPRLPMLENGWFRLHMLLRSTCAFPTHVCRRRRSTFVHEQALLAEISDLLTLAKEIDDRLRARFPIDRMVLAQPVCAVIRDCAVTKREVPSLRPKRYRDD